VCCPFTFLKSSGMISRSIERFRKEIVSWINENDLHTQNYMQLVDWIYEIVMKGANNK